MNMNCKPRGKPSTMNLIEHITEWNNTEINKILMNHIHRIFPDKSQEIMHTESK